jgi:hypothetical protein
LSEAKKFRMLLDDMTQKTVENKPTFRCGYTDEQGVFFRNGGVRMIYGSMRLKISRTYVEAGKMVWHKK